MNTEKPKPESTPVKIVWGTDIHPAIQIIEHIINQKKKHG